MYLRLFAAFCALLPAFSFAVTWTGSHDQQTYTNQGTCLSAQKAIWLKQYPEAASCLVWTDVTIVESSFQRFVGKLSGCAGGEVYCTAPPPGKEEDKCADLSGKDTTINWTVGYTRTPNIDDTPNWALIGAYPSPPADGVICDPSSTCQVALVTTPSAVWQSGSPTSEGLYRLSFDYTGQHLGKKCIPGATDVAGASPNAEQPKCPGAVGEVQGVKGCYGTAANPSRNDVPLSKPAKPSAANPSAGPKPSSGEGSGNDGAGRTPSNGDGGPAGGPAGAAGAPGTKPDGTTPKPGEGKEQANCGAPGQSKCAIDETGTPDGKSAFDKAKADMEAEGKRQLDGLESIKRTDDKNTSWGVIPSWIAHGECSPWNLGMLPLGGGIPIEIDICSIVPYVNAVSNFLWAVFTFFATLSMVFRVTTATKD